MKEKWFRFTPRTVCMIEGDGGAPAGGAAVVDTAPVADPVAAPAADPVAEPAIDPNDPLASLVGDIDKLGADDPADPNAVVDPAAAAVPQAFEAALQISPFVTTPESVQQAVRAADEVWKVANGQLPARALIEGIKEANPAQYESIINDLIPYIEGVTGKKFGGDGPVDPVAQLRSEIQQRDQQREQAIQQQQYQQQITQARGVAEKSIAAALKGTFAEGQEAWFLQRCAQSVNIPEQQMVKELLSGNTKPLEAAVKAVKKEEIARFKQYTDNFIKSRKNLAASVPATKNTPSAAGTSEDAKRLPGESITQMATRLWNQGK